MARHGDGHTCTQQRVNILAAVMSALLATSARSFVIPSQSLIPEIQHHPTRALASCSRQVAARGVRLSMSSRDTSDAPPTQTPLSDRLEPAPSTFEQCIRQAQGATAQAFADGYNLVEVEFPPLQADFLEDSGSSAYDVSSANVRLASRFAQSFAADGQEVAVLLPDEAEVDRAVEDEGGAKISEGVTLRSLRTSGGRTAESLDQLFMSFVGRGGGIIKIKLAAFHTEVKVCQNIQPAAFLEVADHCPRMASLAPLEGVDIYVAIVFSAQELPDLEELHDAAPDAKIVFFNLRLDTLRGDLGLPAFPSRALHYTFLCKIKPVYLLRTRAYTRTISKQPFIVNYQGAQFRVYPGKYQCLLDTGSRYKRVEALEARQTLGDFKETLTGALKLDEEPDNAITSFFRKGFKNRTWWEEGSDREVSDNWRT